MNQQAKSKSQLLKSFFLKVPNRALYFDRLQLQVNGCRITQSTGTQKEQHNVKCVGIGSYSCSCSVGTRQSTDQNNSEYGIFYGVQCTHFFHHFLKKSLFHFENKNIFRDSFIKQLKEESLKFRQPTYWFFNEVFVIIPRPSAKFSEELVFREKLRVHLSSDWI